MTSPQFLDPKDLDTTNSVLTDGQTLLHLAELVSWSREASASRRQNLPLWNILQNLVLCDTVLVDGQLLLVNEEIRKACIPFSSAITPIRVDCDLRYKLANEIDAHMTDGTIPLFDGTDLGKAMTEVERWDEERSDHYGRVRPFYLSGIPGDLQEWFKLHPQEFGPQGTSLDRSNKSILRAHLYLELARHYGVFLSPHPYRSWYFELLLQRYIEKPLGRRLVDLVQAEIESSDASRSAEIAIEIPPVVDLVFDYAAQKNVNVIDAVWAVRESPHAKAFRGWVKQMIPVLKRGRRELQTHQQLLASVNELAKQWREDVNQNVKYVDRTIKLSEIPIIGKVLSTCGMDKVTIRDPVIAVEKPYLLFLNDLYQPIE